MENRKTDNQDLDQLQQQLANCRTKLEMRTAELDLLNSIQQGLASNLEIQEIYELVGEKIRQIFDAQVVTIVNFDFAAGFLYYKFVVEKGQRYYPESRPINAINIYLVDTK